MPKLAFITASAFIATQILEIIFSQLFMQGSWRFITLILNLFCLLIPILFLFRLKFAYEGLKYIAMVSIVYGLLFLFLDNTNEKAFGSLTPIMPAFYGIQIFIAASLYWSLFKSETKDFIYKNN